jgi:hypothetical protein
MTYHVVPMIDAKGVRVRVKDKRDLARLFAGVNTIEQRKGRRGRFSPQFLQEALRTQRSDKIVGTVIGNRGPVREFKTTAPAPRQTTLPSQSSREQPSWYRPRDARGRFKKRGSYS